MKIEIDTHCLLAAFGLWEADRRAGNCESSSVMDTQTVQEVAKNSFSALMTYYHKVELNGL